MRERWFLLNSSMISADATSPSFFAARCVSAMFRVRAQDGRTREVDLRGGERDDVGRLGLDRRGHGAARLAGCGQMGTPVDSKRHINSKSLTLTVGPFDVAMALLPPVLRLRVGQEAFLITGPKKTLLLSRTSPSIRGALHRWSLHRP